MHMRYTSDVLLPQPHSAVACVLLFVFACMCGWFGPVFGPVAGYLRWILRVNSHSLGDLDAISAEQFSHIAIL